VTAAMSHSNLPKIVDKIDPYNSLTLKRRRGSEGSTRTFRTKEASELKALPLLKGEFCFVAVQTTYIVVNCCRHEMYKELHFAYIHNDLALKRTSQWFSSSLI